MRYINDHQVELTAVEREASAFFERQLDQGLGIVAAVDATSDRFGSTLEIAFYGWLLMPLRDERACTNFFHDDDAYEAEPYSRNGVSYLMLRCTTCHRPRGARLVRRHSVLREASLQPVFSKIMRDWEAGHPFKWSKNLRD